MENNAHGLTPEELERARKIVKVVKEARQIVKSYFEDKGITPRFPQLLTSDADDSAKDKCRAWFCMGWDYREKLGK